MKNACRHFLGLYPDNRPSCAKGRDVRAWAIRCNGGSDIGIARNLPCTKQTGNPLFDCPELDRRTDAEVEVRRKEMREVMDRIVKAMADINAMKRKMVKNKLASAKATCPLCGEKDALRVSVNISGNKHMAVRCMSCGKGFIE